MRYTENCFALILSFSITRVLQRMFHTLFLWLCQAKYAKIKIFAQKKVKYRYTISDFNIFFLLTLHRYIF